MDIIQKNLLAQVADLHEVPEGAYNIRANGAGVSRNTTANIDIVTKTDKDGIDIIIKPGTKNESVHIPVVLSQSGIQESVYNDFYIGEDADVTIIKVEDTRYAMAFISAAYFGHPAKELVTIGITGTKGKTTTTYLVKSILENAGYKVGLIGTIETIIGEKNVTNNH